MSAELAEKAWDSLKTDEDVAFAASAQTFQAELTERAEAAVRTGYTINAFEEKVVELAAKAKKDEPKTPLHATASVPLGVIDADAPVVKAAPVVKVLSAPKAADKPTIPVAKPTPDSFAKPFSK